MKKIKVMPVLLAAGLVTTACSNSASNEPGTTAAPGGQSDTISGELTVACYDAANYSSFLEEAARMFEEQHPGTKINIDTFSEMPEVKTSEQDGETVMSMTSTDDPQGRADYISKTSTALMSGTGADLLAMDVLPIEKYIEMGQLENLQDYIEKDPDFQVSDYRDNIINSLSFRNGTWFLPLNYSFNYYAYDSTLMPADKASVFGLNQSFTTDRLIDIAQSSYQGSSKIFSSPAYISDGDGALFSRMFREHYQSFVDTDNKSANFLDGQFEDMLSGISDLSAQGLISKGLDQAVDASDLRTSVADNPDNRFLLKSKSYFSLISQTYPELDMSISTSAVGNGIEKDDEIAGIWSEADGVVPFEYLQAFGINANSPNKDLAWEFLKFLLSHEIQSSPSMSFLGLPLHNQARADKAENLYSMLFTENGQLDDEQKEALAAFNNAVEQLSNQINGFSIRDGAIEDMVIKEVGYYFDGTKTADDVCKTLQNKVELYLNE